MRILFVSPETTFNGGGGIATYSNFAGNALRSSGHEIYTFTWSYNNTGASKLVIHNFLFEVQINGSDVWQKFPQGPFNQALSYFLLPFILEAIDTINPDLIESTDFLGPMFAYQNVKRNGALKPSQHRPVVIYNHGLQREIYRANACIPSAWERVNIALERITLKWADAVFAPSNHAKSTVIKYCGNLDNLFVIPEPYYWEYKKKIKPSNNIAFLGRLSISKGLDHSIHFLNALNNITSIGDITLVGAKEFIPFKISDAEEYVFKKISYDLRDKIKITGKLKPAEVKNLLGGVGPKGFSLNFSPPETFNYAFLEMLDFGWTPFSLNGSAVSEFHPDHLRRYLIPNDFDLQKLPDIYKHLANGSGFWEEVQQHSEKLTNPEVFSAKYHSAVSHLLKPKKIIPKKPKRSMQAEDVTFLIATFNPSFSILETLDSIDRQNLKGSKVLIYSDGSDNKASLEILNKLSSSKVTVVKSLSNEGLCSTRRKLISKCDTQLSVFIDDDDTIEPTYLEKTLNTYNSNNFSSNAVLTWRKNFGANNDLIINQNTDDYEHFLWNDLRMTSLIETSVLRSLNFRPSMRHGEADDWDFWLRFNEMGFRAATVPEALFNYRVTKGSMSWPWSTGQAYLTAELLSRHIQNMFKLGRTPDSLMLEIMTSREEYRLQAESISAERGLQHLSPEDQAAILRGKFIREAVVKHPLAGTIISIIHRGTSWLARKSIGVKL